MARQAGWLGGVIGLATTAALALPTIGGLRLPLMLLFICLGPGCAVVAHLPLTDRVAALGLAVTLSLSAFVGVSAVMAWTGWWSRGAPPSSSPWPPRFPAPSP